MVKSEEDGDPFALLTVLNVQQHGEAQYMQQIKAFLLAQCADAAIKAKLTKARATCGATSCMHICFWTIRSLMPLQVSACPSACMPFTWSVAVVICTSIATPALPCAGAGGARHGPGCFGAPHQRAAKGRAAAGAVPVRRASRRGEGRRP